MKSEFLQGLHLEPVHEDLFQTARSRRPAFGTQTSLAEALGVLARQRKPDYELRDALLVDFIAEYQGGDPESRPLWAGILIEAFRPSLVGLRRRLRPTTYDSDELDQLVLCAFLEQVSVHPVEEARFVAKELVLRLRRQVFSVVASAGDDRARSSLSGLEDQLEQSLELERGSPHLVDQLCEDAPRVREHLWRIFGPFLSASDLDLVAETHLRGREVIDYVRERHPGLALVQTHSLSNSLRLRRDRTLERMGRLLRRLEPDTFFRAVHFPCPDRSARWTYV